MCQGPLDARGSHTVNRGPHTLDGLDIFMLGHGYVQEICAPTIFFLTFSLVCMVNLTPLLIDIAEYYEFLDVVSFRL